MLLTFFLWELWYIFSGFFEYKVQKNSVYLKYDFCNIINVFTVTFDWLNASLLNKIINFFQEKRPQTYWLQIYVAGVTFVVSFIISFSLKKNRDMEGQHLLHKLFQFILLMS